MKYCRLEDIKTEDFFNEHGRRMLAELENSPEFKAFTEKWMKHVEAERTPNPCSEGEACRPC